MKVITNNSFDKIDCIKYGFFTRLGGFSKGEFESLNVNSKDDTGESKENILKNLKVIKEFFKTKNNVFKIKQVHGNRVFVLDDLKYLEDIDSIQADATVTKLKNVVIGVSTADCVPVLLVDEEKQIIASIHAGWRSAISGIIQNTIIEMVKLGANPKNIKALIGPHLRAENFEIKNDFIDNLIANKIDYHSFIEAKNNKIYFDITNFVFKKLQETGINFIEDVNLDTYSNPELFFSFRRATHEKKKQFGCQFSGIML